MSDLEREKFEAWIIEVAYWEQGTPPRREDGRYVSEKTEERWRGWLARSEPAPAPTRESLHVEWMAQEKWLDWSNFLLHKLTNEPAPSDLHSQEFQSALGKLALAMGNPCIEFEAGKIEIGLIKYATEFINRSQSEPGESAPATPTMKNSPTVSPDAGAQRTKPHLPTADKSVEYLGECTCEPPKSWDDCGYICPIHYPSPEDIQGEAGSPAPAPTEEK